MRKGDCFITRDSTAIYRLVGRWNGEVVLASISDDDEEVLICSALEMEKLIATGHFRKLYPTGIKVKE